MWIQGMVAQRWQGWDLDRKYLDTEVMGNRDSYSVFFMWGIYFETFVMVEGGKGYLYINKIHIS